MSDYLHLCKCEDCPLARNPILGQGPATTDIVVVRTAPGRKEVETRKPITGGAERLLSATFRDLEYDPNRVYYTNTVLCRPPLDSTGKDSAPPAAAVQACSARLTAEIRDREPMIVIGLGSTAAQAVLGADGTVSDLNGVLSWREDYNARALATYSPAAVLGGMTGYFEDIHNTLRRAVSWSKGDIPLPPKEPKEVDWHHVIENPGFSLEVLLTHPDNGRWAIDVETDGFSITGDPLLQIGIYTGTKAFVFQYNAYKSGGPKTKMFSGRDMEKMRRLLLERKWILHNAAFDLQWFDREFGVSPTEMDFVDTMMYGLGLTERLEAVSLKRLARQYCNATFYEEELSEYKTSKKDPFSVIPMDVMAKYCALDCMYTHQLYDILPRLCEQDDTLEMVENILTPSQALFANLEKHGVLIDQEYAASLESEWLPKVKAAERALQIFARENGFKANEVVKQTQRGPCPDCVPHMDPDPDWDHKYWRVYAAEKLGVDGSCKTCMKRRYVLVVNDDLNVRSTKQMQHLVFDLLKYAPLREFGRTTGKEFTNVYPDEPISKLLLALRELDHLLKSYVYGILDDVETDGRIHPDFLHGTVTGRLAIHNPPLQTIPKWGVNPDLAKQVRKIFLPTPGHTFVDADYEQLELRVAWHYSEDPALGASLMSGDFHRMTACNVFNKDPEDVTGHERFLMKFVTFGLMYGRQAYSLAKGELNCSEAEAQAYVDRFWATYPKYYEWWLKVQQETLDTGELSNTLGRKRRWRLITPDMERQIRNQAVNTPIQSLASDICLQAAIRLSERFKREDLGHVLFLVHDAIPSEIRTERLEEGLQAMHEEMAQVDFPTCATFSADISYGPSWGDCK